jgi:hypothetical protein
LLDYALVTLKRNHRFAWSNPPKCYRFANKLPLNADLSALKVNWCELTIIREDASDVLYKNAFVSDFEVTNTTVEAIVRDGRARWKVENENNTILNTILGMVISTWPPCCSR